MRNRIRTEEKILFAKRLSLYLHTGIPIQQALTLLRDDSRAAHITHFYNSLLDDVMHGRSLASGLERFPRSFTPFHLSLIKVGETSGSLAKNLVQLATILKRRQTLQKKLVSAGVYPAIIATGTISLTLFLVLYAFPKIIPLFKGFHATLPFPTRVLISISYTFEHHVLLVISCIVAFCIAVITSLRTTWVRAGLQRLTLHLPLVRSVVTQYYVANISRTLATLLQSGIPIEQSLMLVKEGIVHISYRESLTRIYASLSSGSTLGAEFRHEPRLYPDTLVQLITAGEMTGTLVESLDQTAQVFEEQLEELMQSITTLIEPALMIGMGLAVGFVAMAIITPIYGLTQNLSTH